jgi:sec-independent protein translocase protein TatA
MAPLALFGLGPTELIIILVIVLLLFGGTRLAGLGKSTGRAIKEFKEETKGVGEDEKSDDVVDAEVVEPENETRQTPPAVSGPDTTANGEDTTRTNGAQPQSHSSQSRSDS